MVLPILQKIAKIGRVLSQITRLEPTVKTGSSFGSQWITAPYPRHFNVNVALTLHRRYSS